MNHLISLAAERARRSLKDCTCSDAMRTLGCHGWECPVTRARANALDEALAAQRALYEQKGF